MPFYGAIWEYSKNQENTSCMHQVLIQYFTTYTYIFQIHLKLHKTFLYDHSSNITYPLVENYCSSTLSPCPLVFGEWVLDLL
jgi:hypothetical protein